MSKPTNSTDPMTRKPQDDTSKLNQHNESSQNLKKTTLRPWYLLTALLIAVDQLTKWLVAQNMELGQSIAITPFFNLVHVINPGAAFSFLATQEGWQRYFLSFVAIAASIFIIYLMRTSRNQKLALFGLSLILAGALGNLMDRVLFGAVVDFLDFYYQRNHFPAFNFADSCITVGAIVIVIHEFLVVKHPNPDK